MSCQYIQNLATGVWMDISSPDSTTVATISGQLVSDFYLGTLNVLLGTCYSGSESGACISPPLTNTEQSILGELYKVNYYGRLVAANAGAGGVRQMVEVGEFDTRIRWASPNEVAKTYVMMQKDARIRLDNMVRDYFDLSLGGNVPRSIDFFNIDNSPRGGCGC